MKNKILQPVAFVAILAITLSSCLKDLNREPFYGLNSTSVYENADNYLNVLAKLYAGLATTGNQGPAGQADITGIDEGFSSYLRILWNLEELTTDEAVCGWNDAGIPDLHAMNWTSENAWVVGMYYRIYFQIPLCNEFIRESSDEKMTERGFSETEKATIRIYRTEARFLRALSYYHALNLFGNVPFVTEEDEPGSFFPVQISSADLFDYIESELLDIEDDLIAAKQNEYGRADQAAAWALLAKLYLNASVYNGANRNTDVITYCNKIINAGYSLQPNYKHLFLTDNNLSNEIIFPVTFDGRYTQTWGGTTFLVHAPVGGTMNPDSFGINAGWAGLRTTKNLVNLFPDTLDGRYLFYKAGQTLEIASISVFTNGYAISKFKNLSSTGVAGSDPIGNHVDTDFPLFRLADVYLMYAEAALRGGGGGDVGAAIGYINQLRERAFGNTSGNVASIDLDFILDERGRELFWEISRRTDLIRYGRFTGGSYLWPWKGGVLDGTSVPDHLNLYPLPASDLVANTNLVQNPGY